MNASLVDPDDAFLRSSYVANILEHALIGELLQEFWSRGIRDVELLRADIDAWGYDLVLLRADVARYVQLKSRKLGGKTRQFPVNGKLDDRPGGCVIVVDYDSDTLKMGPFWWHECNGIRNLKPAKRTRPNRDAQKLDRNDSYSLPINRFVQATDISALSQLLLPETSVTPVPTQRNGR